MILKRFTPTILALLLASTVTFVSGKIPLKNQADQVEVCQTPECHNVAEEILSAMDVAADPCDDFYRFACGGWIDANEIPETASRWGRFNELRKALDDKVIGELEKSIKIFDPHPVKVMKKYFQGCMNTAQIDSLGYDQFLAEVISDEFGTWPMIRADPPELGNFNWESAAGVSHRRFAGSHFMTASVFVDEKNTTRNLLYLDQPSLVLPSRDYYLDQEAFGDFIAAYKQYISEVARILADEESESVTKDQLDQTADGIYRLEAKLAEFSLSTELRRDPELIYNPYTIAEARQHWPQIDFNKFLTEVFEGTGESIDDTMEIIVRTPAYFDSLNEFLAEGIDTETFANFLYWRRLAEVVGDGPTAFFEAKNKFSMALSGQANPTPRDEFCSAELSLDSRGLPYAVGYSYIREHFSQSLKQQVEKLVEQIRTAFKELLDTNTWMDDETRVVARAKADAIISLMAYPEEYQSPKGLTTFYDGLPDTLETRHLDNVLSIIGYQMKRNVQMLSEFPDRSAWITGPAIVNAFYEPTKNSISFPAGILESPFFRKDVPSYLNYGGIGLVIGHEITHGFDDQGRQYDSEGNLSPWWPEDIVNNFVEKAQCYIDQYSSYKLKELIPLLGEEDAHVNGALTQGENIADNGGLHETVTAYRNLVRSSSPEPALPGLEDYSSEQMLFLSFAQVWCEKSTPESLASLILTDPHSPGKYRVWGALSNSKDFARAFQCPAGSNMNPKEKCDLW